ncbi:Ubiquitin family protein [Apiospora phragmitis]|uniref:Ubiquitin family protein n=1 Tax=Apiospora phragmitis TaxID=2905665 RepID=A0ABR1T5E4_9PEZI
MASEDGAPTCTIQVVSPSVGVPSGRLSFSKLPASTTIQQLKQRVRDALDAKPPDAAQRLIHRGRLLARDNETLLEIFGEETLRSGDPQAIHLVLRDLSDGRPTNNPTPPVAGAQPTLSQPTNQSGAAPQHHIHTQAQPQHAHVHHTHQFFPGAQPQVRPAAPWPNLPFGMMAAQPANMPFAYNPQQPPTPQQMATMQQRQWATTYNTHMLNAHMENQRIQELINQNQRERAAAGLNGAQDVNNAAANPRSSSGVHTPGRTASPLQPDGTRTVVREGVGPNGQQWRITVNESITNPNLQRNPRTGSPFSMADVQNLWRPPSGAPQPRSVPYGPQLGSVPGPETQRAADAGQAATRVIADAMRRNASTSSLASLSSHTQPIAPGVTTPLIPSRSASAAGTPDPARAAGRSNFSVLNNPAQPQGTSNSPEVFILSSPEGPGALLFNGNHGTYVTPQQPQIPFVNRAFAQQLPLQPVQFPILGPQQFAQAPQRAPMGGIWAPTPAENAAFQLRNQQQQQHHHQPHHPQGHAPVQAPPPHGLPNPPQIQLPPGHGVGHPHANVQIRAIALGQIWPHIWMILRLILFIWWFTSPTSSWSRWFTVITIAVTLFLFNAGLLNPLAEQAWVPMRRHLENLMPLADNHGRNPVANPVARRRNGRAENANGGQEPDPADTAERLVQERREANANWFLNQVRRLERAGILFLASIAPGVAERHIANVEAEARAERQRQEAAEAAAAEAARAAEENQASTETQAGQDGDNAPASEEGRGNEAGPEQQEAGNPNRPGVAEEPLIAI